MMIGLDGFELSVAERFMAQGGLPALKRLKEGGAAILLDHGDAKRSGLAWEHVSSGQSPDDAARWAAVDFDPDTYQVRQRSTRQVPFVAGLGVRTVVFDPPYFALNAAPGVRGLVNWGAHDPGVPQSARPGDLLAEIEARFGKYPARNWIYGFVWPSQDRTRTMAEALEQAVRVRSDIAAWLFGERLADWDLGYMVISEYHSAIEAMWHGVDEDHPLHRAPSAQAAGQGVRRVYEAADQLLGRMMDLFPEASFVVFNLHGMGANDSDIASMALLPELLFRHAFGESALEGGPQQSASDPWVGENEHWDEVVDRALPKGMRRKRGLSGAFASLWSSLAGGAPDASLEWMPATRYGKFWKHMPAFALPSFYDGRIRINLMGREADGVIHPADYEAACQTVERLLMDCRDIHTDRPVVRKLLRNRKSPVHLAPSECDIEVVWAGPSQGFTHPDLGQIGPLPFRRTGGHTGQSGVVYVGGPAIGRPNLGVRSAFDVAPTVVEMLGGTPPATMSGESFLAALSGADGER
jgi:predicted AlkP superfamily phosphohydrolase/phosphomutase